MNDVIKITKRPWAAELHHTSADLRATYFAQSAAWHNGKGPSFTEVGKNSALTEAPNDKRPRTGW